MSQPPQKSKLAEVAKHPGAYALIFLAGLIGFLVRGDKRDGTRTSDCKEQIAYWQRLYHEKDSSTTALTRELLITKGVIAAFPDVADSAAHK